jgi:flagellar biogenesis protein FliO
MGNKDGKGDSKLLLGLNTQKITLIKELQMAVKICEL